MTSKRHNLQLLLIIFIFVQNAFGGLQRSLFTEAQLGPKCQSILAAAADFEIQARVEMLHKTIKYWMVM